MSRLMVLVASTRPGRVGLPVAEWVRDVALERDRFDEIDFADLAEINLPFLDEPNHPRLRRYEHEHTKAWSARVEAADAFIFVTPEYNFAMPATLKNAIDYLFHEWAYKPVAFVSYGGASGGIRSVQMAKQVVTTLRMFPLAEAVALPFVSQLIDDAGAFRPNEVVTRAAEAVVDQLARVAAAMEPLRESAA